MQPNYAPWTVEINAFPKDSPLEDQLKYLLRFAVLAPSSHNSQPWRFGVQKSSIRVASDPKRSLPASDPNGRYLHFALGCAIENIRIAADHYGFASTVDYSPTHLPDVCAAISLRRQAVQHTYTPDLISAIPERRTNRSPYTDRVPDDAFLRHIENLSDDAVQIVLITDQKQKERIADALLAFREHAFDNPRFRGELSRYKRNNWTRSPTGMPGFTMGFSTLLSLVAPTLIKYVNVMKFIKNAESDLLNQHTPVFILLGTREDNKKHWMMAGQRFERMVLEAERAGIATAISAIPQDTTELQRIADMSYRPQIFCRMGYAAKTPAHAPRLSVDRVTALPSTHARNVPQNAF